MRLVPLIRQPSGICWNEKGHLFVSELHGYNLEGQFDIEELNKSGELDKEPVMTDDSMHMANFVDPEDQLSAESFEEGRWLQLDVDKPPGRTRS